MNEDNLKNLMDELREAGALEKESEELAFISKNLSNLYSFERSNHLKTRFLEQNLSTKNKYFIPRQMFATAILSLVFLLGLTSVVGAQKSLPGQSLYPVKRLSENIISFIKPSFKGEILERRSEEIKELSGKKDGDTFRNTVDEYERELNENKAISSKKIEEAQKNLEEARNNSLEEHREDIERVIIKTENRQGDVKRDEDGKESSKDDNEEYNRDSEGRPRF